VRIGIDYTPAYEQGGGIGRLVRNLVAALAQYDADFDYRLFVAGVKRSDLPSLSEPNFSWNATRVSSRWLARIWHRARMPLPVELFVGSVSLYHAMDFVLPPTLPVTRTVVTVHDMSFVRVPDAASPQLRQYLNRVVPRSVRRADCVIADSQSTKDDLIDLYGVEPDKISVLLSGIASHYFVDSVSKMTMRSKYNIPDAPYIFSVGTVQPRKNYSRLIQALVILRRMYHNLHLVIAGGSGWLEDDMYRTIEAAKQADFVHLIGFVDDADLPALYHDAACVAYPSLYEGFGFPVLEAMASGTPVVTSNVSSLPEVAGDAALLVDPYRVEEIAHAIQRILGDSELRQELIQRGYKQAAKFTWANSAKQLHQIYTKVLAT